MNPDVWGVWGRTERCRLCHELHDAAEFPELRRVCQPCWQFIQDYLTERNMTIIEELAK